jgi:RHS repeat-associated protein
MDISDGLNTLTYDGENRVVTSTAGGASTYTYDGNGLRVKKVSGTTTTVYIFSGAKVVGEYDNGAAVSAPTRENIYAGSDLLATLQGGGINYYTRDHLSVRKTYDASANLLGQQGHFPFGESWYTQGTSAKWQFTSYERDPESGNDYALARFHVNRLGRFSSPDPLAGPLEDPQSLNRYSYALNDGINLIDPSGKVSVWGGCFETEGGYFCLTFGAGGGVGRRIAQIGPNDAGGGGGGSPALPKCSSLGAVGVLAAGISKASQLTGTGYTLGLNGNALKAVGIGVDGSGSVALT